MRDVLHDWWPVAAVTLFTLLLVLQIPRKAIFPPVPSENAVAPFADAGTGSFPENRSLADPGERHPCGGRSFGR